MNYKGLILVVIVLMVMQSCFDPSKPNYQYFPNMYEPVGYETYADSDAFANGIEAQLPVAGSVARGWEPYDYPDTNEGYEKAKAELKNPLPTTEENLEKGKVLYDIYCASCHGTKGDGNGVLSQRDKFNGIPSYTDRELTPGNIYHVIMYGKNLMGSHASQLRYNERWQVVQYVEKLRSELK